MRTSVGMKTWGHDAVRSLHAREFHYYIEGISIGGVCKCHHFCAHTHSSTMSNVQLLRLASVRTVARPPSNGISSVESPQDRIPSSSRQGDHNQKVRIEVFAHGNLGQDAVFVASLSNSALLVIRIGSTGQAQAVGGLRSWLLEWPVAGKIRGLCVSPDLQCVLCVTEDLEGVYILSINNLGAEEGKIKSTVGPETDGKGSQRENTNTAPGRYNDITVGGQGNESRSSPSVMGVAGASTGAAARPFPRSAAEKAFPSLLHLASRGQRRRATGGGVAHTPAEPIFIASLARAGGKDGAHGAGRYSKGSSGRASQGDSGKGARRSSRGTPPTYECLWWAAQNGDHLAVIGGLDGEVHFLDLERLDAWVVEPPPPSMSRGRVCAMSISTDVGANHFTSTKGADNDDASKPASSRPEGIISGRAHAERSRHLVVVLEAGAVFVVLLEHRQPRWRGPDFDTTIHSDAEEEMKSDAIYKGGVDGGGSGDGGNEHQPFEYAHLKADQAHHADFAPVWLDIGRGGGGGGGGGVGVRLVPSTPKYGSSSKSLRRLHMSVVSRAWGNRCSVKMLRLACPPDADVADREGQQGKGKERGRTKHYPLRTETARTFFLPVDHAYPEEHALAAVDGEWVVLASPSAGGAPARVSIAPLDWSERAATNQPVRVFSLPLGEQIHGVSLFHGGRDASDPDPALSSEARGKGNREESWGVVWSEFCVYRVILGVKNVAPLRVADMGQDASKLLTAPTSLQSTSPPAHSHQRSHTFEGLSVVGTAPPIAVRRPSTSSVRRARELYSEGHLAEAAQVAIEALDGRHMSSTGPEETTGGGVTTRMVREDLANSLLEWLVALHVQHLHSSLGLRSQEMAGEGDPGAADNSGSLSSSMLHPGGEIDSERSVEAVQPWRTSRGRDLPRGFTEATDSSTSSAYGRRTKHLDTGGTIAPPSALVAPSRLERYLLSSLDYDPVGAAALLHANGEADLAVLAGTFRGGSALLGVLRVLAESTWPPRLGPRAVEAICGCEDGSAVRKMLHAGGGMLYAALEPRLQCRLLLSERSILFGKADEAADKGEEVLETGIEHALPEGGASVASVQSHLASKLYLLPATGLATLIWRLAQWSKEVNVPLDRGREGKDLPTNLANRTTRRVQSASYVPALEALEVVLAALCELGGRGPPFDDGAGRREWLSAGCLLLELGRNQRDQCSGKHEGDGVAVSKMFLSRTEIDVRRISGGRSAEHRGEQRLEWSEMTSLLCDVLAEEGIGGEGEGGDEEGFSRLPTAARRSLQRVLPIVQGWHDPVRMLMRARGAGCWAAVAVELELSRNSREAASAMLHGVVTLLQGGWVSEPGEIVLILGGRGRHQRRSHRVSQAGAPPWDSGEDDGLIAAATSAMLQIIDVYAFRRPVDARIPSDTPAVVAEVPVYSSSLRTSIPRRDTLARGVILSRASVLAEALCVWEHFALPVEDLEAALRPRLDDTDDIRVLAAVFFPRLSPDSGSGSAIERDFMESPGFLAECTHSPPVGPSSAQMEVVNELNLKPRFLLSLTRACGSLSALSAASAPAGPMNGSDASATGSTSSQPDGVVPTDMGYHHASCTGPDDLARPSSQLPLSLLLEHRVESGKLPQVVRLGPHRSIAGLSSEPMPVSEEGMVGARKAGWPLRAMDHAGRWPRASHAPSGSTVESDEVVYFSCGHVYGRKHLLENVVPACVSRVRHSTSSLRQTQQILAMEYERWTSGAACPECATKELARLVADLRPTAGASAVGVGESKARSISAPSPQRFQAHRLTSSIR